MGKCTNITRSTLAAPPFTFINRFKVVSVTATATISELLALTGRTVVKPTGDYTVAWSNFLGQCTNIARSILAATILAVSRRCKVVSVAATATIRELLALAALTIEKPTGNQSLARPHNLREHANTRSTLAATILTGCPGFEVVPVAAAATISELLALFGLAVEKPTLNCGFTRSHHLWQITNATLPVFTASPFTFSNRFKVVSIAEATTVVKLITGCGQFVIVPTWFHAVTWPHVLWQFAHIHTGSTTTTASLTLHSCFKVVSVAAAATIRKELALASDGVEEVSRQCTIAGAHILWQRTNAAILTTTATILTGQQVQKVVGIALATTILERIARFGLVVVRPTNFDSSLTTASILGRQ